jgi:hypothetical protein
MQYRRLPMKNARYCWGGLLGRDRSWPTQRLSAWRTPTTAVPSSLRLRSGACGCHGRARGPVLPMTTYCSNPALSEDSQNGARVHCFQLGRTAAAHNETVDKAVGLAPENALMRQRLANTLFAQIFAGSPREREGWLLRAMAWTIVGARADLHYLGVSFWRFRLSSYPITATSQRGFIDY